MPENVIVFSRTDGTIGIISPAYGDSNRPEGDTDAALIERCMLLVPLNTVEVSILDKADIPVDRSNRDAWRLQDGRITSGGG